MNECLAFGIVADIGGLLTTLMFWAGGEDSRLPEPPAVP